MAACAFCGRDNQGGARYCIDCGKPLTASAAQEPVSTLAPGAIPPKPQGIGQPAVPPRETTSSGGAPRLNCANCNGAINPALPFCPHCGTKTGAVPANVAPKSTAKLTLLNEAGAVKESFTLSAGEAIVGRSDGDIRFPDDVFLSPVHAQFALRNGKMWVRDLGSRNGTWVFVDAPHRLVDGDVVLVGSQFLRYRRLGYPGPNPAEADRTRRLGSLTPGADISVLAQLRADGSVRDTFHLSPGRNILIGREKGDWIFPYDQTMSGAHAEVRSEDSDFAVTDAGSRNGIAIAVRGERPLVLGQRVLMGDHVLRLEHL